MNVRRTIRHMMLVPVLLVQALSSCSLIDVPLYDDDERVDVSLAFSLKSASAAPTRMADEVTQINGDSYRGMQDIRIIPFALDNPENGVQLTDRHKLFEVSGVGEGYSKTEPVSQFYYFDKCSFMTGTNAVLVYGRAAPKSDPNASSGLSNEEIIVANKAYNGSMVADYPLDMELDNVKFQLEQMVPSTETVPSGARTISNYLTGIARAPGWSTATESYLRAYYLNFIGQLNEGYQLMAGSSASVTAYVNDLKAKISALDDSQVKTNILNAIGTPNLHDYPRGLGLPDGAAALKWDSDYEVEGVKGGFKPQTITTTEAAINSITRFTYPAELYYFGNTRLYTSNTEVANTVYATKSTWDAVLDCYVGRWPVSTNTLAVALKDPVQYAVARLNMKLSEPTNITLTDSRGKTVTITNVNTSIPLTGIIIGGQHTVGFDFQTHGEKSDVDARFVYDSHVSGMESNTLVLQNFDDEKVIILLELENKTGAAFTGKDGVIYPNTKFYLLGEVDPTTKTGDEDIYKRVFTQDYTTEVTMSFVETSLANAYNVVPDLLAERLEIGVKIISPWYQTTPTVVPLNE